MKKQILSLITFTLLCSLGFSQYYYLPYINIGKNPGELNADLERPINSSPPPGWKTILGPSVVTPTWSRLDTIPFVFLFNGAPVSLYKASSTGIVTFSTGANSVPGSTPSILPNAAIPDQSVCVWGIETTGSNDVVCTKTFGTSPNRQYWVQYSSCTYLGQVNSAGYWSVVFEETTNNIYIVDQHSASGNASLTLGIQTDSQTAVNVFGSPSVQSYAYNTYVTAIDNSYYKFVKGSIAKTDVQLNSITPIVTQALFGSVGSSKTITGIVENYGSAPITSLDVKYSDGSTIVSQNYASLNLVTHQTFTISFTTPYVISSPKQVPLKIWVEEGGDTNHINDTLKTVIKGYSFVPNHKVVFEEATGTWCGWCPGGTVFMDSMSHLHPNTTVLLVDHNRDPMMDSIYDAGVSAMIAGWPTVLADRKSKATDPPLMFDQYASHINDFSLADLLVTPTFDNVSREATVIVNTKMASTFKNNTTDNDFRIAVVFTESNVKGTTSDYAQHNYYSNNQPLKGAGHDWQKEADPVPANKMKYDFVVRTILGGFKGQANSLPDSLKAGITYSTTFKYIVPAKYNAATIQAHALLIDANANVIYNGNSTGLILGINGPSTENVMSMVLYPNPTITEATMDIYLTSSESVIINIYNTIGELVYSEIKNNLPAGESRILLHTESLVSGIYNIKVSSEAGFASQKLMISK